MGTLTNINNALNGLTFTPNTNFAGGAQLQVAVDDQGNTGSGGPKLTNPTLFINVIYTPPNLTATGGVLAYVGERPGHRRRSRPDAGGGQREPADSARRLASPATT